MPAGDVDAGAWNTLVATIGSVNSTIHTEIGNISSIGGLEAFIKKLFNLAHRSTDMGGEHRRNRVGASERSLKKWYEMLREATNLFQPTAHGDEG